jgi:hypothetical protein
LHIHLYGDCPPKEDAKKDKAEGKDEKSQKRDGSVTAEEDKA